jgi:hypothetical protein
LNLRTTLLFTVLACLLATGCTKPANTPTPNPTATAPEVSKTAGPLPERGFKAQLTLSDPPLKLRTGEQKNILVKIRNASDVIWWQRGGETNDRADNQFYIAVGNHWLGQDGKPLPNLEGHNGIPKDIKPGEEVEAPLLITAPKAPGDYTLEVDLVQEGVAWFHDKGSPTTSVKVRVDQ